MAFPGGHIDYGEDPVDSCVRELKEECGIDVVGKPELLTVRGKPDRDPRYHMVSIFYTVHVADDAEIQAGDDASTAGFYPIKDLLPHPDKFAFDHH